MIGNFEYPMSMGRNNHVCYEVTPPLPAMGTKNSLSKLMGLQKTKKLPGFGTFKMIVEPMDEMAEASMSLLRVYVRKPGSDDWVELPARVSAPGAAAVPAE